MPRKPTNTFSNIVFRHDGTVGRNVYRLPEEKQSQEHQAFEWFVKLFNETDQGSTIDSYAPLPEADHDFSAQVDGAAVEVQLAELSPRAFRSFDTNNQPISGSLNPAAAEVALRNVVAGKVAKRYARGQAPLWLVVFSTEFYNVRYLHEGKLVVTRAVPPVWEYLDSLSNLVFNEIWFTDLQTRPVKLWPSTDRSLPCHGDPVH